MKSYNLNKHGVTQTLLSHFIDCRQYAEYWIQGLENPMPRPALIMGNCVHEAMDYVYSNIHKHGWNKQQACSTVDKHLTRWRKHEIAVAASMHASDIINESVMLTKMLIPQYIGFWFDRDKKIEWIQSEFEFKTVFNDTILRGKIDGVCRINGNLWIVERKTKSQISELEILDSLAFDFQSQFYMLCAELVMNKPVYGVIYDVIRKPQLRQGKNENAQNFYARISNDIGTRREHYFKRFELARGKKEMLNFRTELAEKISDFKSWNAINHSCDMLRTYKNQLACKRYYTCQYINACATNSTAGLVKRKKIFPELKED